MSTRPVGRPAIASPKSASVVARVSPAQKEAYIAAGGARWLRALLDRRVKK